MYYDNFNKKNINIKNFYLKNSHIRSKDYGYWFQITSNITLPKYLDLWKNNKKFSITGKNSQYILNTEWFKNTNSFIYTKKYIFFDKLNESLVKNKILENKKIKSINLKLSINSNFLILFKNIDSFTKIYNKSECINLDKVKKNIQINGNIKNNLPIYLSNLNLNAINSYYWEKNKIIKNYGNFLYSKEDAEKSILEISTIADNLKKTYLLNKDIFEPESIVQLNSKISNNFEKFIDSYSASINFKNISNFDGKLLANTNENREIYANSVFDNYVNAQNKKNSIIFENFYYNYYFESIYKLLSTNPEKIIYGIWDILFEKIKYSKKNYKFNNIKEKLSSDSGHIDYFFYNKNINSIKNNTYKVLTGMFNKGSIFKKLKKNIIPNNELKFNYSEWSDNFAILENKFEKNEKSVNLAKNSKSLNVLYAKKQEQQIEYSLQKIEQFYISSLGSNYLREILYSHYGSWMPKYGFFSISTEKVFNPDSLTKWSNDRLILMDKLIDSGNWLGYFEYRNSIKNYGELDFIKKYIYLRSSQLLSKGLYENHIDYTSAFNKKIIYRPFDSYVSLNLSNSVNVYDYSYSKIWGWILRDYFTLKSNYFRLWYVNQLNLEKSDIKNYGKILPKTLLNRQNNPEFNFIDSVNDCMLKSIKSNINIYNDLFLSSNHNSRLKINKLLRLQVNYCLKGLSISTSVLDNIYIKNLSQSESLNIMLKHDAYINMYKLSSWNKKKKLK